MLRQSIIFYFYPEYLLFNLVSSHNLACADALKKWLVLDKLNTGNNSCVTSVPCSFSFIMQQQFGYYRITKLPKIVLRNTSEAFKMSAKIQIYTRDSLEILFPFLTTVSNDIWVVTFWQVLIIWILFENNTITADVRVAAQTKADQQRCIADIVRQRQTSA